MSTIATYAIHPLADLIPAMTDGQYAELRDDIAAHGLRQPIVLFEHMVLDGRHRLRACEEIGATAQFEEYIGDEPAAHVLSLNLHRRHLSTSQRAMIATDFLPHLEEESRRRQGARTDLHPTSPEVSGDVAPGPSRSAREAAAVVGVHSSTVERAKRVVEQAPELAPQIRAGDLSVDAAIKVVRDRGADKPETGRVSARSAERIAQQAGALANAVNALHLTKSCARLTEDEREEALRACKSGLKALNALANALGR